MVQAVSKDAPRGARLHKVKWPWKLAGIASSMCRGGLMSTPSEKGKYAVVVIGSYAWKDSFAECVEEAAAQAAKWPAGEFAIVRRVARVSAEVTPIIQSEEE